MILQYPPFKMLLKKSSDFIPEKQHWCQDCYCICTPASRAHSSVIPRCFAAVVATWSRPDRFPRSKLMERPPRHPRHEKMVNCKVAALGHFPPRNWSAYSVYLMTCQMFGPTFLATTCSLFWLSCSLLEIIGKVVMLTAASSQVCHCYNCCGQKSTLRNH